MKKTFTLVASLAVCMTVSAGGVRILSLGIGTPGVDEPQLIGLGISPDGRYVCGSIEMGSGYFVGDLESDVYKFEVTDDDEGAELRHIDNNGVAIGYNGPGITYSFDTASETVLQTPDGDYKYVLGEAITNDGGTMVGSLVGKGYITYASYSRDGGEWTLLPMPSDDIMGPYAGTGSAAKYVSGDGRLIVGSIGNFGPVILWKMNGGGEYEPVPLFDEYVIMTDDELNNSDKNLYGLSPINVSNNGRFVLCRATMMLDDAFCAVPAVYDTENETLELYDEPQEIDSMGIGLYPCAIDNKGTFVGIIGTAPIYESLGSFVMKAGETQAVAMTEAFPEYGEAFGLFDGAGFSVPVAMSADGGRILGYSYYLDNPDDPDAAPYCVTYVIETGDPNAVESVATESVPDSFYSVDGRKLRGMQKGINIVRMTDGSVRKVLKN